MHDSGFDWHVLCLQVGVVEVGGDGEGSYGLVVLLESILAFKQVITCDHHVEILWVAEDVPRLSSNLNDLPGGSRLTGLVIGLIEVLEGFGEDRRLLGRGLGTYGNPVAEEST